MSWDPSAMSLGSSGISKSFPAEEYGTQSHKKGPGVTFSLSDFGVFQAEGRAHADASKYEQTWWIPEMQTERLEGL